MSPVSRSSAVGARVRRRSKNRNAQQQPPSADADYVDPWDIENELYVKRLSVAEPPPIPSSAFKESSYSRRSASRRTSNCYYDIAGFEEEQFQNDRLYSYEGIEDDDAEYWSRSAYNAGDYYYYYEDDYEAGLEQEHHPYHRFKPTTCLSFPDGHTYEECEQKHNIYSEDYYIPMMSSSGNNLYPSTVGYQLYAPTRRSLASNAGSQLKRVYETRKSRMALPTEDGGFYERDYGSWRWKELPDNQRLSVLSGYYSDELPGDLTDDSLAPYSELRGPPPPIPASHFGLTKHGHLKIDYSCNWSSLDRFIGHANNNNNNYSYQPLPNQVYG